MAHDQVSLVGLAVGIVPQARQANSHAGHKKAVGIRAICQQAPNPSSRNMAREHLSIDLAGATQGNVLRNTFVVFEDDHQHAVEFYFCHGEPFSA